MSTTGSVQGGNRQPQSQASMIAVLPPKPLRAKEPKVFSGKRDEFRAFVLRCDTYIKFNPDQFSTDQLKVLWASSYFEGETFNWFEKFATDAIKNPSEND